MLIIYRVGVFVPTPGIDAIKLKRIFEQASNTLFGVVNMFSGGALENFSVFALGIMPYISVSIIVQLLTHSIPTLKELSKEGEQGRRIITKYTRIFTIALALIQGTLISIGLESQNVVADPGWAFRMKSAITLAAGTAFIMWLGEQITERGIGNGISLIIMAGIVARMPSTLIGTMDLVNTGEITYISLLGILLFAFATVAMIVFVEKSQRRIPVQYPRRAMGRTMTQAATQHLPLKLNSSGVMPPIFASALMVFPATIAAVPAIGELEFMRNLTSMLHPGKWAYEIAFAVLIMFISYFYTALTIDTNNLADNLKKNGGFVPTVRPGKETAAFFDSVLNRLTFFGAIYLCIICIAPTMYYLSMNVAGFTYFFGGTAVLIVVGVMLDTTNQFQSHLVAKSYDAFMNKGPGKIRGLGRARQVGGRLIQR
jgi:preprotein translocase subunit SecY